MPPVSTGVAETLSGLYEYPRRMINYVLSRSPGASVNEIPSQPEDQDESETEELPGPFHSCDSDRLQYPAADIACRVLPRHSSDYRGTIFFPTQLDEEDKAFCQSVRKYFRKGVDTAHVLRSISLAGQNSLDPKSHRGEYERSMMHFATRAAADKTLERHSEEARERDISLSLTCSRAGVCDGPESLLGLWCCRDGKPAMRPFYLSFEYKSHRLCASDEDCQFVADSEKVWDNIVDRIGKGEYTTPEEEKEYYRLFP